MQTILSIQSHVAYGYVGNRVATFVLQRLGHDVIQINTVQFSNHTGYGEWQGDIFSPEHIAIVLKGLHERDVIKNVSAILTGYIGSEQLGRLVLSEVEQCKKNNPKFLYCCDPVFGDVGRDLFVPKSVADFFRDEALQYADIITPNLFELAYLTNQSMESLCTEQNLLTAIKTLQQKGPKIILVTSVHLNSTPKDCIDVVFAEGEVVYRMRTPKLSIEIAPNGAGDAVAAMLLGKYLQTGSWIESFEETIAGVFAVLEETADAKGRELQLITAQEELVSPKRFFVSERMV